MHEQKLIISFKVDLNNDLCVEYTMNPPQQMIPTIECKQRDLGLLALSVCDHLYQYLKRQIRNEEVTAASPIIEGV